LGYIIAKVFPTSVMQIASYSPTYETFQYANYVAFTPPWREVL
jgi:hypothetical protein